jgi:hypothetical protein
MIFDSNLAWQRASATIRTNREVLFALAGVFFLLPTLAFSLFFPQPTPPAGGDEAAMMQFAADWYAKTIPVAIPVALIEAAGTMALLTLMTDRSRPTVGQAIRTGFVAMPVYIAGQLVLGFALGMAALVVMGVLSLTGSQALTTAGLIALVAGAAYVWVRTSLSAPVVAVERVLNPFRALRRSWELTCGNGLRLLVFYALIVLVFAILLSIILALMGIVLALVMPAKPAALLVAMLSAGLQSVMVLTFVSALAAAHAQMAGGREEALV